MRRFSQRLVRSVSFCHSKFSTSEVLTVKTFVTLVLASALVTLILLVVTHPNLASANTAVTPQPVPTPSPDLTWIKVGPNKACGTDGAAPAGSEKAELNQLKNRFTLPDNFEPFTFDNLLGLNQGQPNAAKTAIVNFPNVSDDENFKKAVTLEGYVDSVSVGGCSSGESCNCKTQIPQYCDTHINVLPEKNSDKRGGRNVYVVEITRRIRILASKGLLSSNIGNNWSTAALTNLEGHRVRFSGYLYFDTDHSQEAWVNDPENKIGFQKDNRGRFKRDRWGRKIGNNWRQTAWEVHPVMGIEVLD